MLLYICFKIRTKSLPKIKKAMGQNTLNGHIILQPKGDVYLGFIAQYPAICAQGDTIDQVKDKLKKFAKKYFDYMSNSSIDAKNTELVAF
jgi:predicted RNase H-like HicB family nuclease